ncbi:MAG: hypothetical protein Q8S00_22195 [Deltaproteobacteria bacterium]|nr:hypothetical protein [Deltaproteobacteria bacterium]
MKTRDGNLLSLVPCLSLFLCMNLTQTGCDKVRESVSSRNGQTAGESSDQLIEKTRTIDLSMDSLIDRVAAKDKERMKDYRKKGNTTTVGFADGREWLEWNKLERLGYIRALADMEGSFFEFHYATRDEIRDRGEFEYRRGETRSSIITDGAYAHAQQSFRSRIHYVVTGRRLGEVEEAITEFYRVNSLLRDKPVLWVLAVPLYKQIEKSVPNLDKSIDTLTVRVENKSLFEGNPEDPR